jgi:osmotically-inducible protein OsmY
MIQTMTKSDSQLQQDVLNALKWDSRLDASNVQVAVDDGVVTLTGKVTSYVQKMAAAEAAHRVCAVLDVADDITVKLSGTITVTDAEIAHAARTALMLDATIPDEQIQTTVSDGWVTLEGQVDLWCQIQEAERMVRHITGVIGISNKISVTPQIITAEQVRSAISEAIERQAVRTAAQIRVAVCDGVVTLAGAVRSLREKQAVLAAIGYGPGIVTVDDQLVVDPLA